MEQVKASCLLITAILFSTLVSCSESVSEAQSTETPTTENVVKTAIPTEELSITKIEIDGVISDWSNYPTISEDPAGDQKAEGPDFVSLKSFFNDEFLYLFLGINQYGGLKVYRIDMRLEDGETAAFFIDKDASFVEARIPITNPYERISAELTLGPDGIEVKIQIGRAHV